MTTADEQQGDAVYMHIPAVMKSRALVPIVVVLVTCIKVLLIPSYRSTDFDVHRNWLSVTRHLPSDQWYFYDANETTVHTLDYPPLFAFFELFWSSPHNFLTQFLLSHDDYLYECLALRPDHDNEPSAQCVVFQRATVILSDLIFLMGSHLASKAMEVVACRGRGRGRACNNDNVDHVSRYNTTMILLLLNPGLLWLDHVHFQYNGMLLGLLLGSMGCLVQAFFQQGTLLHANILGGAILFGLLVGMKHLYLTLAPLYFVYLLRHYCFVPRSHDNNKNNKSKTSSSSVYFSLPRLLLLGTVTLVVLVVPFVPFVSKEQLMQIMVRLFPFQRGLCHDYWAANVFSAMSSFMLGYHVHEKAIMTAIVPMTLLAPQSLGHAR
eukprot:scaffold39159_cov54-Attheya_sp.AAC.3